jgi:hypothetical protein
MSEEKEITIKQILDWCLKKTQEGSEVILKWDGGGDSGWVHLEVDEEDSSDPEAEKLIDMMYDQLDYGSWAGEFSASGEASFDPETQMFQGTDYYTENDSQSVETNIEIRIPKHIHFSDLEIHTEDLDCTVTVTFGIRNGFDHPDAKDLATQLEERLSTEFIEAAKDDVDDESNIEGFYETYNLFRSDFTEDGDDLVYIMKEILYNKSFTTENYVEINLQELLEEEEAE